MSTPSRFLRQTLYLSGVFHLSIAVVIVAAAIGKISVAYSFNNNEGWNAFWAAAAWEGSDLYAASDSFRLDNYPPLWFYATGALGRLTGDKREERLGQLSPERDLIPAEPVHNVVMTIG